MAEHSESVSSDLELSDDNWKKKYGETWTKEDQIRMDASYTKDAERWVDGYTNHNSQALCIRALATMNGHSD